MRYSRVLLAALIVSSLLPTSAQDDTKPYFSLSTGKTYGPGDKPALQMWSQNVDSLEFRVYRVNDPILFFQKMEDVHRAGRGKRAAAGWADYADRAVSSAQEPGAEYDSE
jgi:hypothetical protein